MMQAVEGSLTPWLAVDPQSMPARCLAIFWTLSRLVLALPQRFLFYSEFAGILQVKIR